MTDVFISYSRRNSDFARKLTDKLRQVGKESWVDWEGIPLSSPNWWHEIMDGIDKADNFVFIMSKDSMASVVCNMELDYALDFNKRVIIVVYEDVSQSDSFASIAEFIPDEAMQERLGDDSPLDKARDNWVRISHINWLFFRENDDFDTAFKTLVDTVETNLDYVKSHTRYLERAQDWVRNGKRIDLLLFGDEIMLAEEWLKQGEKYAQQFEREKADSSAKSIVNPLPQDLHYEYIKKSRAEADQRERNLKELEDSRKRSEAAAQEADQRRQRARTTLIGVAILSVILIGVAIVFTTSQVSDAQAQVADASTQVADANQELTSIPPTLTQVNVQVVDAQVQADAANTQVGMANAALTAVPPTLTQVNQLVIDAQGQADAASTEAFIAENMAFNAQSTATVIPPTLTEAALLFDDAEIAQQIADAFGYDLLNASREEQNAGELQYLDAMADLYPDNYMVYTYRALVYINAGNYESAMDEYDFAIELDPENIGPYLNRANTLLELGDTEQAIADYNRVAELEPEDIDAYWGLGNIYFESGDYEQAIENFNRMLEINPEDIDAYFSLGNAYNDMEQYEQAIENYNRAIELNPEDVEAINYRGNAYFSLEQYDQAIADYNRAIELDPDYADAYWGLGDVNYELDNLEEAVAAYRELERITGELEPYMQELIDEVESMRTD